MKHQPQLAAAAQKAAAMVPANEAGAEPSSSYVAGVNLPSPAAVNGETVTADSPPTDCDPQDCDPQTTESTAEDELSAVVEDQSCDQAVAKEEC